MNTVTNSAATSASATVVAARRRRHAAAAAKVRRQSAAVVAAKLTKSVVPDGRTVVAAKGTKPAAKPAAPVKANPAKTDTKTDTKAKPVKKNATKGSVGRPKKVIKLVMDKTFSLRDVVNLNPTTNKLTVRKHILDGVKAGVFMKLTSTVSTGKRGKPAHLFVSAHEPTVAQGLNAAVAVAA